jgi:LmbE family N-acetylglucosaminyl deacetylase
VAVSAAKTTKKATFTTTLRFHKVVVSDVDPTGNADHAACTAFAATIVAANAAFVWCAFVTTIVAVSAAKTTIKATFTTTLRNLNVVVSDVDPTGNADHAACTAFAATIVTLNAAFVWCAFVTIIVAASAAKTIKKATFTTTLRFRIVVVSPNRCVGRASTMADMALRALMRHPSVAGAVRLDHMPDCGAIRGQGFRGLQP